MSATSILYGKRIYTVQALSLCIGSKAVHEEYKSSPILLLSSCLVEYTHSLYRQDGECSVHFINLYSTSSSPKRPLLLLLPTHHLLTYLPLTWNRLSLHTTPFSSLHPETFHPSLPLPLSSPAPHHYQSGKQVTTDSPRTNRHSRPQGRPQETHYCFFTLFRFRLPQKAERIWTPTSWEAMRELQ